MKENTACKQKANKHAKSFYLQARRSLEQWPPVCTWLQESLPLLHLQQVCPLLSWVQAYLRGKKQTQTMKKHSSSRPKTSPKGVF